MMFENLIQAAKCHADADTKSLADTIWLAMCMATPNGGNAAHAGAESDIYAIPEPIKPEGGPKPEARSDEEGASSEAETELVPGKEGKSPIRAGQPGNSGQTSSQKWIGALPSLQNKHGFRQALRAFASHSPQPTRELDELETVEQCARQGGEWLTPVMQKGMRRWLKICLVAETTGSNALWTQPLEELEQVLRLRGVFRQVSRNTLCAQAGTWQGWKNEIIVVASDFTSDSWWNGDYPQLLRQWAKTQPVVLMHTLPPRLWHRSWVGKPDAWASATEPAQATGALHITLDAEAFEFEKPVSRFAFPLVGMEAASLENWAMAIMQSWSKRTPAIVLAERDSLPFLNTAATAPRTAEQIVMTFRGAASPLTKKLAQYMAVTAPLNFPVMRWVQQAMLPETDASHLAEFFLGGLLERVGGDANTPPDEVRYDFIDGVRSLMQQGLRISHGLEVLQTVGQYLEKTATGGWKWRTAIESWGDEGQQELSTELSAFALVSQDFMHRIGLADRGMHFGLVKISDRNPPKAVSVDFKHILWVDDQPNNNSYIRQLFEAKGFRFTLATSTADALIFLKQQRPGAVISDMGRVEGPREGYVLLEQIRKNNDQTPIFFYSAAYNTERKERAIALGAQGFTNDGSELLKIVIAEIEKNADVATRQLNEQLNANQIAAETSHVQYSTLPVRQPFFGRSAELAFIERSLHPAAQGWGVVLTGPGGIGKTALALEAAYRAPAELYPVRIFITAKQVQMAWDGVQQLREKGVHSYYTLLTALAMALNLNKTKGIPEEYFTDLILKNLSEQRVLFVLDSLEVLRAVDRRRVYDLLEKMPAQCRAIVTSRRRDEINVLALQLDKIDFTACCALLTEMAERMGATGKAITALITGEQQTIYSETGGNPLLLTWVAAQLGHSQSRYSTLVAALERLRQVTLSPDQENEPLYFIFGDLVDTLGTNEIAILAALTVFSIPAPLAWLLPIANLHQTAAEMALGDLRDRSLVLENLENHTWQLPALAARFLSPKIPHAVALASQRLAKEAIALAIKHGGGMQNASLNELETVWPLIQSALPILINGDNEQLQQVCIALDYFLEFSGRWNGKLLLAQQAEAKAVNVRDFANAGRRALQAGHVHDLQGNGSAVLDCAMRCTSYWQKIDKNPDHDGDVLRMFGRGYRLLKDYNKAIEFFSQALELFINLAPDSSHVFACLSELAGTQQAAGAWKEAETNYKNALHISNNAGDQIGIATCTSNLATLAMDQKNWAIAETLASQALSLFQPMAAIGQIAYNHQLLAQVLFSQQKINKATFHAEQAVINYTKLASADLPKAQAILAECKNKLKLDKSTLILFVDDKEEAPSKNFERAIGKLGVVISTDSSANAKQILGQRDGAIAVLVVHDWPNRRSLELVEYTKKTYPAVFRMVTTSYNALDQIIELVNLGIIDRYIPIPWDITLMRIEISRALRLKSQQDELELLRERFGLANINNEALCILYIDEDETGRKYFSRAIGILAKVIISPSEQDGMQLLSQYAEKLAALVINNAFPSDVLNYAEKNHPSIQRVICTNYTNLDQTFQYINAGQYHSYIQTPWDITVLRMEINLVLKNAKMQRELDLLQKMTIETNH